MSVALHHECTRVPVTALAACGRLLFAAEGPFLRVYCSQGESFRLLNSTRIFKSQSIHGISIRSISSEHVLVVCWGGRLVRALDCSYLLSHNRTENLGVDIHLSSTVETSDWLFDLSWGPRDAESTPASRAGVCAAVSAHNALLELTIERRDHGHEGSYHAALHISVSELVPSSRSILYSAHLLWESHNHILIAAGTAFGELIFWSWRRNPSSGPNARIHRIFLGHEGSIFGVHISKELNSVDGRGSQRLLASCSDDRTIRIWDVSMAVDIGNTEVVPDEDLDTQRTRHTGFNNSAFDSDTLDPECLAIGWGHTSRVWTVQFIHPPLPTRGHYLLSTGEDATSRVWKLTSKDGTSKSKPDALLFDLLQLNSAAYHNGKNIWSVAVCSSPAGSQEVVCGAADSKITARPLTFGPSSRNGNTGLAPTEYTVDCIVQLAHDTPIGNDSQSATLTRNSSRLPEFFRSYSFIDSTSFLLTTNSGKVYLGSTIPESDTGEGRISHASLIDNVEELSGYSICIADTSLGIGFVAGSRGGIYIYHKGASSLTKIHSVNGKVGSMYISGPFLLLNLLGQKAAQMLEIDFTNFQEPTIVRIISVALSDMDTGLVVTSFEYVIASPETDFIILGFRKGAVTIYSVTKREDADSNASEHSASLIRTLEHIHGKETVTSLKWIPSSPLSVASSTGYLISVGRDGCLAINSINLYTTLCTPVHHLPLPFGSNIEGLYYHNGRLIVCGFSSTKFVLYDTSTEAEIMSVETGGAHRSWTFQPSVSDHGGGILVWTRAASMHVYTQLGPNHQVIRPGGHGREIKAVASSMLKSIDNSSKQLIATGSEDTDIKIFEYTQDGEFVCRRTLRKHTTGIQQLQWSDDGKYLFSSGGCEEFYVWRIHILPGSLGIGVVCVAVCAPESKDVDIRITAFDVLTQDDGFLIALVFSDSTIRMYKNTLSSPKALTSLSSGVYCTSSLTQCKLLSFNTVLTTGTDGYAVFWPFQLSSSPGTQSTTSSDLEPLIWKHPTRIHQSTSKVLVSLIIDRDTNSTLLISGGDDGSLAFLLTSPAEPTEIDESRIYKPTHPAMILTRAHASAITACVVLVRRSRTFVVTSGNDQWVRIWEIVHRSPSSSSSSLPSEIQDAAPLNITRVQKIMTNVADVSSMTLLDSEPGNVIGGGETTRVLICGVGMEVVRIDW
ncbi:WD40 repeat-like protein, partial [Pleomassaria siparia CBS 279.74]